MDDDALTLRYSIMSETRVPYSAIDTILLSQTDLEKDKLARTLSPLGELESYNVILQLKNESPLLGLYGIQRKDTTLALPVDEENRFKAQLEEAIQRTT